MSAENTSAIWRASERERGILKCMFATAVIWIVTVNAACRAVDICVRRLNANYPRRLNGCGWTMRYFAPKSETVSDYFR